MARSRGPGLAGLLWGILGVVVILSLADLVRGRDSTLRSWWSGLAGGGESRTLERFVPREPVRPSRP